MTERQVIALSAMKLVKLAMKISAYLVTRGIFWNLKMVKVAANVIMDAASVLDPP